MTEPSLFPTAVKKQTLAEQVVETIREAILKGRWQPGEALPTEPELAEAFGVSRAVVRDATRMLAAQGLVQAQHGRGVFVTESQVEAFGDALLLALRREQATVWDMEQFEQMVMPEVCALAAQNATEEERTRLRTLASDYLTAFAAVSDEEWDSAEADAAAKRSAATGAFVALITAIYDATHNAMWQLLVRPLLRLRSMRSWEPDGEELSAEEAAELEQRYIDALVSAVTNDDPATVRDTVARLMRLPGEAESAMRNTPIGEKAHIPFSGQPG